MAARPIKIETHFIKLTLFLVVLSLVGCQAALKVSVDVFDSKALHNTPEFKQAEVDHYKHLLTTDFSKEGLELFKQKVKQPYISFINNAANFGYSIDSGTKTSFIKGVNSVVGMYVDSAYTEYHSALENLVRFQLNPTNKNWDIIEGYVYKGNLKLEALENLLLAQKDRLNKNFKSNISLASVADTKLDRETNAVFKEQLTSFGQGIAADEFTSLIIKAPKKYWRKLKRNQSITYYGDKEQPKGLKPARFNRSVVRAFMGNVDVAIKMESPGNYIVKGVRLDADAVLSATSRVMSQAVKYIAMTQGVGSLVNTTTGAVDETISTATSVLNEELLSSKLTDFQREYKQIKNQFLLEMLVFKNLPNSDGSLSNPEKAKLNKIIQNHKTRLSQLSQKYTN